MNTSSSVAVCSRSFSQNPILRQELLKNFSKVRFNETGKQLQGEELISFLQGADRAIIALEEINESVLQKTPDLKVIGKYGVGLDKIDFQALENRKIQMGWTPGVNAQGVAELTLAMAMIIVRNMQISFDIAKQKGWKQVSGRQLSSMTYGILGCGHVGRALAKLLRPIGCQILVCDIESQPDFYETHGMTEVSLQNLMSQSDVLSLHIPKNRTTAGLLDQSLLQKMKQGAYLINTARGGLVDESTVLSLLNSGHLAGAAFDVFEHEPPTATSAELIAHPRCYSTTHIGGSSQEAILSMGRAAIQGLIHFQEAKAYEKYR